MIIVHHLNDSRSQRVLWLLEELGLDYDIRRYHREPDLLAPPELKFVHPLGKAPIVEDTAEQDVTLIESGAICEYLVRKVRMLGEPTDLKQGLLYHQYMHYAEGSVMPLLFAMLVAKRTPIVGHLVIKRLRPLLDLHLDFIENELSNRPLFAGDSITAADIMMSFPLEAAQSRGYLGKSRPATARWIEVIHTRPAYQQALAKGGAYSFGS